MLIPLRAESHPNLNFTIVINPCNGPCANGIPEKPYTVEVPKLKTYHNVRTLGYVATNYTNKPVEKVLEEIKVWANWTHANNNTLMGVDGVFFDEVPGGYDWEQADYLKQATNEVKGAEGLGQRTVGMLTILDCT